MAVEENKINDEAEIKRLLDDGIRSLRDKNIDGKWLIVHHQNSVPVDLEHGKAVLNLKP